MKLKNAVYRGAEGRESLIDLETPDNVKCEDIIVFVHGFKGFKDWGCWNMVQQYFIDRGIGFCKMNLSHNGGTVDEPIDFPDLDAFGDNRYSYEVKDIEEAMEWIMNQLEELEVNLHLVGHSRGGGDVILAGHHPRVKSVITWAGIDSIPARFPEGEELEKWRKEGVRHVKNGRTGQEMPHRYSMYEDWEQHREALSIEKKAQQLDKPTLHLHGDVDEAVSITASENLSRWTEGKMIVIRDANHTFGSKHPFKEDHLPPKLYEVCSLTLQFIEKQEN